MKKNVWGIDKRASNMFNRDGDGYAYLESADSDLLVDGRLVSRWQDMASFDGMSLVLVSGQTVSVEVADGDSATQSTDTLLLKNGNWNDNFVGATITIEGSSDNDGDHVITSVPDSISVVCSASDFTDEDFDPDAVTITVKRPAIKGDWDVEISNTASLGSGPPYGNAGYGSGDPVGNINDQFTPAFQPVVPASPPGAVKTTMNQPTNAPNFLYGAFRVCFTPAEDAVYPGVVGAFGFGKGND